MITYQLQHDLYMDKQLPLARSSDMDSNLHSEGRRRENL